MELADVARRHGPAYLRKFAQSILPSHRRALNDIIACRTEAMGGHVAKCDHCLEESFHYHSCCNRSCPKCRGEQTRAWLVKREGELLPVPYFHVVFTVPSELNSILRSHQQTGYGILFKASASALRQLAAQPRFVGADVGMMSVLHTWGRDMNYHPHIHSMVTGGGIAPGGVWKSSKPNFLVPKGLLSKTFRVEFKKLFEKAFPDEALPPKTWSRDWVVEVKLAPPGNKSVLKYLGRYIHRVAISNSSIRAMDEETVTFAYTDTSSGKKRRMPLKGCDFLARFLQHVLPKNFRKVRYYGAWNPSRRSEFRLIQLLLFHLAGLQPPARDLPVNTPPVPCPSCGEGILVRGRTAPRIPRGP